MAKRKTIRFRGRVDDVLDELSLDGTTYQLLEQLGGGGRVRYRAFDRLAGPHGDYCAIHVLPRSPECEQQIAVFKRIDNVRNNNVPSIVRFHRRHDRFYLVLKWIDGRSLKEHLERVRSGRETRISAFHACGLIRGLAHGLCQFHFPAKVNHGDIKPANLILAPQGKFLSTIDFGSAWLADRAKNRDDGDGISGPYSAPELLETGKTPDFRSDQFSVSVVWYELLTGQLPYDGAGGKAGTQGMRQAFAGKLLPPSRNSSAPGHVPAGLWKAIDGAVCRGLAFDANERFPDRTSWLSALDEIHFAFRHRRGLGGLNRRVVNLLSRWFGSTQRGT